MTLKQIKLRSNVHVVHNGGLHEATVMGRTLEENPRYDVVLKRNGDWVNNIPHDNVRATTGKE